MIKLDPKNIHVKASLDKLFQTILDVPLPKDYKPILTMTKVMMEQKNEIAKQQLKRRNEKT